ncbi:MAG: lipid 1-phosphatase [Mucilaginibacter sp.]|uniref:phosphatase PAP2 family protein n=1 Tax=Mucilaginibacter sp. TaxID=1882438 RepID=UPI00262FAF73|nr:phosphatase PAP2 family protein [Mucilaginibacter sp.]MDB5004254.1 lipid 1-phosphatase [Mucilaginibacter sp.]
MKKIIFALLYALALEANAQVTDTVKRKPEDNVAATPDTAKRLYSKPGTFIVPAILVGYGALSFVAPVRNIDYYLKMRVERSDPNYSSKIDDYLQIAPAVLVYGLNLAGYEGKNRFVDRTALITLSAGILTVTDGLKYLAHRTRPYGTDPLSFPSGHTGAAFLCAEFLAQEYSDKSPLYGVLGYTLATTTGIMRVYGRAHWFSDCVAGAGFGILSTKVAYLVYPIIRNALTHKDKHGRSTMVIPTYQDGVPGLSFAMQL